MSTINDVARLAGVSTATVSRVINTPERVRTQTRDRVFRAMKMCNYKYNALARGFATKRTNTIGMIIPNINNPVFAESTRGIQDYAEKNKIQMILGNSYYSRDMEKSLVKTFLEKQVDGLILTPANPKGELISALVRDNLPLVLLYSTIKKGPVSAVGIDNYKGGYAACRHLVDLGHRRIAMVAGKFSISDRSFHRWHGYKKCLGDHGIPYDSNLLVQTGYSLTGGRDCIKKLMGQEDPPTAVFCSNDYLAIGAMKGARELGIDIPGHLSVIGFDDIQIASYISPALTTISQPAYEMGRLGAEILFGHIQGQSEQENKACHKMLDFNLVVRESTAKL
ncbi:MAG: LacI family DNA-binding transcriptional regulator [Desulfobacter sp.]|nr:MAG: LacI family DNA-binding transcriptional regulator [Desulfobacter sp.]